MQKFSVTAPRSSLLNSVLPVRACWCWKRSQTLLPRQTLQFYVLSYQCLQPKPFRLEKLAGHNKKQDKWTAT